MAIFEGSFTSRDAPLELLKPNSLRRARACGLDIRQMTVEEILKTTQAYHSKFYNPENPSISLQNLMLTIS